ncbi:MAG: cation diffusion facilitator family transporter [Plesiomonas sp.]|uniref:cation diffusion facilitator family transporter n=1 Tax=Plesiomonas sp. TaxID=2486279 RepID=UPI003F3728D1
MVAINHALIRERQALKLSLAGTIIMSGFGIGYGLSVGSDAIFMDGLFSLLSMAMTGLGLMTAYLVARPDDHRFQYGYAHLEPLINVVNGSIILLTCIYAFFNALLSIRTGGHTVNLDSALIYASLSTLFCLTVYWFESRVARSVNSELVSVDAKEWLVDSLLSATILVGFCIAKLLEPTQFAWMNLYIDSVMVLVLALVAMLIPINVLRRNLREVLLVAPRSSLSDHLDQTLSHIATRHGFIEYSSHLAKIGRRYEVEVNILVPREGDWGIHRQDNIRAELWAELGDELGSDPWLSLCFTSETRWL